MPKKKVVVGKRQNDWWYCRVPASQEVAGRKTTSSPKSGKLRSSTRAVSNVPVQEPRITRTDPKNRNFRSLRTGDSGNGPKKSGQRGSEPAKAGKNENLPEKNIGNPKISSRESCSVKTIKPPEKHRRKRRSHPRKPIENDVSVKEPQLVNMERANGSERWFYHLDNKSGK